MLRRLTRPWRMLPRDTRFAIIIFALQIIAAVLIIVFLPPLLRAGMPLCRP